ncbi:hypothetical protein RFI_10933 [Reticulomyxa filosa]|uniref:Inositol oxygenase n=1 Tax=Reticulomyxa filosa TaxID=46433 RepID=X6NJW2_RETFI|nr:hypothetical protein RFI_10933 [Reticulomyxa filosa]|eukprot:ETO26203.1 hypothetical protein RFI_10933 [Reticulomyxa filosa]
MTTLAILFAFGTLLFVDGDDGDDENANNEHADDDHNAATLFSFNSNAIELVGLVNNCPSIFFFLCHRFVFKFNIIANARVFVEKKLFTTGKNQKKKKLKLLQLFAKCILFTDVVIGKIVMSIFEFDGTIGNVHHIYKLFKEVKEFFLKKKARGKKGFCFEGRKNEMTTHGSCKKRSLCELDSCSAQNEPATKKAKVQTCSGETKEEPKATDHHGHANGTKGTNGTNGTESWAIDPNKKESEFRNYATGKRQETVQNFYKEQHTKMTYEVALKKREEHLKFNKCVMTVWDMIHYLDQVVDDSDPDTNLTQIEHAIQTGEAARKVYPGSEYDWFHVTALIHDLGKILAVKDDSKNLKKEPQWCVVGDTFPVGCQFSETNIFYDDFADNPDNRDKRYNTFYGVYSPKCGLNEVVMSWGHDEYMYHVAKTQSTLPEQALYILRFHSFYPWHNKHGYMHLCNDKDLENLKWVKAFQKCDLYSKSQVCPKLEDIVSYYKPLLEKYFPKPVRW